MAKTQRKYRLPNTSNQIVMGAYCEPCGAPLTAREYQYGPYCDKCIRRAQAVKAETRELAKDTAKQDRINALVDQYNAENDVIILYENTIRYFSNDYQVKATTLKLDNSFHLEIKSEEGVLYPKDSTTYATVLQYLVTSKIIKLPNANKP